MCEIDLSIRVINEVLPETVYAVQGSSDYIHPRLVADHLGDFSEYDGFALLNPSSLTTATTFRGVGGTSNSTPFMWVKIGSDERAILCHEFGHALTAYLSVTTGEYTNFPVCGGEPAMHCNQSYGYSSDIASGWLEGFLSGLRDGTAMTAEAWAIQTPTQRGNKRQPKYRAHNTPWGYLPPLHL